MQNLQQMLRQMQGGMGQGMPPPDSPVVDTAEQVYISSLALLKMLKHGNYLPIRSQHSIVPSSLTIYARSPQVALACRWRSWA